MEKKNIISKINDAFCKVEKTITWIAFAIMLGLLLIQVFCRYLFEMPLAWAEEMVRYTYIAVSFLGAAVALRERTHISIDILPSILENKIKDPAKRGILARYVWTSLRIIVQTCIFHYTCPSGCWNTTLTLTRKIRLRPQINGRCGSCAFR